MSSSAPFTRRIPRRFTKTVTFDGSAGGGAVGTVAVATVTGSVLITHGGVRCLTLPVSAGGGTLKFGCAGNTDGLILQTTATSILAGNWWQDATPEVGISPAIINQLVDLNLILTVGTATITAGVLEIVLFFIPCSDDGNLS